MKIKNIIITSLALLSLSSCSKYLDIKPFDKVLPETAEDFSALLHYHLNAVDMGESNWLVPEFTCTSAFDAGYGDDFEVCLSTMGGARLPIYIGQYIKNNNYNDPYSKLYAYIRDANIIIHDMKETSTTEANDVLATAYAIRGVSYYQLLRLFCDVPDPENLDTQLGVPIVTRFDMEARPPRSTMRQTLEQIESDLKESISYNMTNEIYRFTPDVCRGFLARLYFWSLRWEDALTESRQLLAKYPLRNPDEFITMMNSTGKLTGNQLIKAYRGISVSSSSQISGSSSSLTYRPISIRFISNFPEDEKETDVRYNMSVNVLRQFKKPIFCGMRAAEFKFIEAESLYHLNRHSEALAAINELRRNRIRNYSDIQADAIPAANQLESIKKDVTGKDLTPLLSLILRERRKEFFLEGDRFYEMKRNGRPEYTTFDNGTKYTTKSFMYTMPIPIREFDITDNLIQNPGYNEIVNLY